MKEDSLVLITALLLAATLIASCLGPVNAAQVNLASDAAEYGGWMDAKELLVDMNSTHKSV